MKYHNIIIILAGVATAVILCLAWVNWSDEGSSIVPKATEGINASAHPRYKKKETPYVIPHDSLVKEFGEKVMYNDKVIYGKWFEPHGADHHIVFHNNNTFQYNDCSNTVKQGTFEFRNKKIILSGQNGWKKTMLYKWNGTNHYLTDSNGICLVKGS